MLLVTSLALELVIVMLPTFVPEGNVAVVVDTQTGVIANISGTVAAPVNVKLPTPAPLAHTVEAPLIVGRSKMDTLTTERQLSPVLNNCTVAVPGVTPVTSTLLVT